MAILWQHIQSTLDLMMIRMRPYSVFRSATQVKVVIGVLSDGAKNAGLVLSFLPHYPAQVPYPNVAAFFYLYSC